MCDIVLIYAVVIRSQIFTDTRVARRRLGTGRITRSKNITGGTSDIYYV